MLRKCAAVLAVVSCLAAVTSARAEPGPVGQWLMGEPASLFDIGMIRLSIAASAWGRPYYAINTELKEAYGNSPTYKVEYDWDENRIVVTAFLIINSNERPDAELACKKLLSLISDQAWVASDTGKILVPDKTNSHFADYFTHIGYERTGAAPEDYRSRLDQIFVIKGRIPRLAKGAEVYVPHVTCSRRLLSNKVYFEE